jgi:hypothetical protein
MKLLSLKDDLSQYFLRLCFHPKGKTQPGFDKPLALDTLWVARPWDGWQMAIYDRENYLQGSFGKVQGDKELFTFCLLPGSELEGLLEIIQSALQIITQNGVNIW